MQWIVHEGLQVLQVVGALGVHQLSHAGNARVNAGMAMIRARCTKSAARNGRTPLNMRLSGMSGAMLWMTYRLMPIGG